ncbi:protein phosphatase 2C domain-containing protein [Spirillospora sp. NPDC052269]
MTASARPCPTCGDPVQPTDQFCERCGRERPGATGRAAARPGGRAAARADGRAAGHGPDPARCVDCGALDIDEDGYCGRCGLRQPTGREHMEIALTGPDGYVAAAGVSDVGRRRRRNEDAFAMSLLPAAVCAVVCDGVATAPGSDEASRVAADTGATVLGQRLAAGDGRLAATRAAIDRAAAEVAALAVPGPSGSPACTYVSVLVDATSVTVGWVGDSRAYWIPFVRFRPRPDATPHTRADIAVRPPAPARPGLDGARVATVEFAPRAVANGQALTRDDSWAEEMIRSGAMTPEAAHADRRAHLLTGWLGADAGGASASVAAFAPDGPGVVLVCSDGLWNYLPDAADLAAALGAVADPVRGVRILLDVALGAGGRDNVTAVLIPFPPPDAVSGADAAPPGRGSAGSEPGSRMSEKRARGAGLGDDASDEDDATGTAYAPMPYEPTTRAVSVAGTRPETSMRPETSTRPQASTRPATSRESRR